MGSFGFSWVGLAFLLALFVPNIVWAAFAKPTDYNPDAEDRTLRVFERVGQIATTTLAVVTTGADPGSWTAWSWWLVAAVALLVAYEITWIRYFTSTRTAIDFTRNLLGIRVPLASLPVAAFLLLGVYERSFWLILAVAVLAVGHIGLHLQMATRARPPATTESGGADSASP